MFEIFLEVWVQYYPKLRYYFGTLVLRGVFFARLRGAVGPEQSASFFHE